MPESKSLILVVEDDTVTRETIGTVLEERGYRVVLASNAPDALLALEDDMPDLVLTDMSMPSIDGFTILGHVHASQPGLPVILITADHELDAEREAHRLGASDFINKPVDLEDMLTRIAACLANRQRPPTP